MQLDTSETNTRLQGDELAHEILETEKQLRFCRANGRYEHAVKWELYLDDLVHGLMKYRYKRPTNN